MRGNGRLQHNSRAESARSSWSGRSLARGGRAARSSRGSAVGSVLERVAGCPDEFNKRQGDRPIHGPAEASGTGRIRSGPPRLFFCRTAAAMIVLRPSLPHKLQPVPASACLERWYSSALPTQGTAQSCAAHELPVLWGLRAAGPVRCFLSCKAGCSGSAAPSARSTMPGSPGQAKQASQHTAYDAPGHRTCSAAAKEQPE